MSAGQARWSESAKTTSGNEKVAVRIRGAFSGKLGSPLRRPFKPHQGNHKPGGPPAFVVQHDLGTQSLGQLVFRIAGARTSSAVIELGGHGSPVVVPAAAE